jgi:hypothetical protein
MAKLNVEIVREYKAAVGAQFNTKKAQEIGEVLESLGDSVTPGDVVHEARKKRSPLHNEFDWDDESAANKFRLTHARHILGHINVVVTGEGGEQQELRAFYSINFVTSEPEDEDVVTERRYVHIKVAEREPAAADDIVAEAKRELDQWRQRYKAYRSYFGSVFEAIEKV